MKLDEIQWSTHSDLRELLELLHPAMIVGGAVRNSLLGLPISDIDVATELLPEQVTRVASLAGFKVFPTGIAHGTVTCVKENSYEVTTLRVDKETDGRHAKVEFSRSWQGDADRRDFTINALYSDFEGNILDLVGGLDDLAQRRIRFIGEARDRITEDYLRILRFFRFYAHYCGRFEVKSHLACLELADNLRSISRERCTYEFMRLLDAKKAHISIELMSNDVFVAAGLPIPKESTIQDMQIPGLSKLGKLATFSPEHELVLSRQQVRLTQQLHSLPDMQTLPDYIAWINSCDEQVMLDGIKLRGKNVGITMTELENWIKNRFPLKGQDILELGYEPGPQISQILDQAKQLFCSTNYPMSKVELLDKLRAFQNKR